MKTYHMANPQMAYCDDCGIWALCSTIRADSPEPETGYVDEYTLCSDCLADAEKVYA